MAALRGQLLASASELGAAQHARVAAEEALEGHKVALSRTQGALASVKAEAAMKSTQCIGGSRNIWSS